MTSTSYTLRVPATTANLGPGFDSLGLALNVHNTFTIRLLEPGRFEAAAEGPEAIDLYLHPHNNMVTQSFLKGFELGGGTTAPGVALHVDTHIPTTRGLGSSSSAVVAGLVAGYHAARGSLDWPALLEAMTALEGHPDNVLSATLGGIVCGAWQPGTLLHLRRVLPDTLVALAYIPDTRLSTKRARAAIPHEIPHTDAVYNAARTPLVMEAFYTGDLEMLMWAMRDRLHQPFRAPLIDSWEAVEAFARQNRLPFALSGAGPTIIMWCRREDVEGFEVDFRTSHPELMQRGQVRILCPSNEGMRCPELEGLPRPTRRLTPQA